MEACCRLCYVQYLESSGEVDAAVVALAVEARSRPPGVSAKRAKRMARTQSAPLPVDPTTLCRCDCHVKGAKILH